MNIIRKKVRARYIFSRKSSALPSAGFGQIEEVLLECWVIIDVLAASFHLLGTTIERANGSVLHSASEPT